MKSQRQMSLFAQGFFFHTSQTLAFAIPQTSIEWKQSSFELTIASCSVFSHLHELKAVSVDLLYCCTQRNKAAD